ncbi:hypothetical protein SISSUDRAFT_393225 [Sistotremastrum suecicum HHB10207 ss-3]|uniref:Uncharacterized protein n=1 Tax=Sistotremastrum suecicum HHB10207 ss-3 TaxID=1314776 RepID=A0A165YWL3_9AGAM|nr:hypothetical protein SISSUDRAFT_393225 [Sistotremastrum suecicum HHB10207 ss-3]
MVEAVNQEEHSDRRRRDHLRRRRRRRRPSVAFHGLGLAMLMITITRVHVHSRNSPRKLMHCTREADDKRRARKIHEKQTTNARDRKAEKRKLKTSPNPTIRGTKSTGER